MSAQRATEGLESSFSVDLVQGYDSGRERYYAFQLGTPVSVRIYEPTAGRARLECSCEDHRITQSECAHIFVRQLLFRRLNFADDHQWLFAGLLAVLTDEQITNTQGPVQIEMPLTSQLGHLYPLIEQRHESLPQALNHFHDEIIESDDNGQEPFTAIDMETRTDILCDILSSFDSDQTPDEFKHRFVDYPSPRLSPVSDSSLVQGSLPATIYHLACRDDQFYRRLQEVVPPDYRATQYYQKQFARAQNALRRLSQYAETGSPAGDGKTDVPECARQLRLIVDSMCEYRETRNTASPLGAHVSHRLAELLAKLITQVVTWDRDIYEDATWNRPQPTDEHPRERNLFVYLIGDPPFNVRLPRWMKDRFVIDRLGGFPSSEWSHLLELFTTIKDGIEEMDMDSIPGSFGYVAKIDELVSRYTATVHEPSSSSAQPRRA